MKINNPNQSHNQRRIELDEEYTKHNKANDQITDEETEEEPVLTYGLQELKRRRLIPLGKNIYTGKPFFMNYPKLTDTTYNVFAFVGPMGSSKTCHYKETTQTLEHGVQTIQEIHEKIQAGETIHVVGLIGWTRVTNSWDHGIKKLYEVTADTGASIKSSAEHKHFVYENGEIKEKRVSQLTEDDWLITKKQLPMPDLESDKTEDDARILGIILADGYIAAETLEITTSTYLDYVIGYLDELDITYNTFKYRNTNRIRLHREEQKKLRSRLELTEERIRSEHKRVPGWVYANEGLLRGFLQGYLESDGCFLVKKPGFDRKGIRKKNPGYAIAWTSKSLLLGQAIVQALHFFGIQPSYRSRQQSATNGTPGNVGTYHSYNVNNQDMLRTYLERVGVFSKFQQERVSTWNLTSTNRNLRYPLTWWFKEQKDSLGGHLGPYWDWFSGKQLPADNQRFRDFIERLEAAGHDDKTAHVRWLTENYQTLKVKSIEELGEDQTYDIETEEHSFLAGTGIGFFTHNSTNVRSMIYYSHKLDPECITIIFDPMKMEYSKMGIKATKPADVIKKKENLLNETLQDPETGKTIQIELEPDNVEVFHVVPRFALQRDVWDEEDQDFRPGYDQTTIEIMRKDGGFVFAEDASRLTEEQLFNALNFRELRTNQVVHFYLRIAMRVCDTRHGKKRWFIENLISVLREGVRKYRQAEEVDDLEEAEEDKKTGLSSSELQLIETLEKYNDAGFFIKNAEERKHLSMNLRKIIRLGKVINISYMGFKKTEKVGEDFVVGQTDLMLERLIAISNEYYDALRKQEAGIQISDWEEYLVRRWKISLWFEESEIFMPRDCSRVDIKRWPCIKRLDYLLSFSRKYGFKNFGFITQRIQKVNPIVFEEANNIFLGPLVGEGRDKILSDFGVSKLKFPIYRNGQMQEVEIRDIVSTLQKEKYQWVYISKAMKTVAPISTYDSPVGT